MVTAVLIAVGEALLVWVMWRAWRRATRRARDAEAYVDTLRAEIKAREVDNARLQEDLARLRAGTPADRVGASLDILQDVSDATRPRARKLAESKPPAADGN